MKARGLAEAEELVVYEAILDVVELINVLHNFLTLFRYKVLDKSVSANGNPKANVAVVYKGLGGEQRTEVGEGGISSKQALCGRVRLSRRDTPDKNDDPSFIVLLVLSLMSRPASSLRTSLMSESTASATESLALM